MNLTTNNYNGQPLHSFAHLQTLPPDQQEQHIALHTNAIEGHFQGSQVMQDPNHAQHQEILNHVATLQQNHERVQMARHDNNPRAFRVAVAGAHEHLSFMIQHQNHQDAPHDSDNETDRSSQASSISSGEGMQIQPG